MGPDFVRTCLLEQVLTKCCLPLFLKFWLKIQRMLKHEQPPISLFPGVVTTLLKFVMQVKLFFSFAQAKKSTVR